MLIVQALLGILVFTLIAMPLSSNWRRISWKLVAIAVALQFAICALLLKAPVVKDALLWANRAVGALGDATSKGTSFVYGYLGGGATPFTVTNPGADITITSGST
jgi:concentrative nucleoside transporter, CNT family